MPDFEELDVENYSTGPFHPTFELPLKVLEDSMVKEWQSFSAGAPDLLWHYTDAEGFRGMVANGTLRFSHARLLNDATEIAQGWSRVIHELDEEIASQNHLSEFYKMTRSVADGVHKRYHYFIFSLSARDDSLSQWRAYGSVGSGYSLGFDSEQLRRERPDGEFALVRLIYDESDHRKIIRAAIRRTREFFQRIDAENPPQQCRAGIVHRANVALSQYLMNVSRLAKDSSFEDEREWRLIVGYDPTGDDPVEVHALKKVLYRSSGGLVRPYFDFDFGYEGDAHGKRLPLRIVRYGPALRAALTEYSIRLFLNWKTYSAVVIKGSNVPLEG